MKGKRRKRTEAEKKHMSEAARKAWEDPAIRQKRLAGMRKSGRGYLIPRSALLPSGIYEDFDEMDQ